MPEPKSRQIVVTSTLQNLANAIGLKQGDVGIAHASVVEGKTRVEIAGEQGVSERSIKHALRRFAQFYKAANMTPEEAIKALSGGFDEDDRYIPLAQRYGRRVEAMAKEITRLNKRLDNREVVVDTIVDALIGQLGTYDPQPFECPPIDPDRGRPEYAVLEVGDWQFGSSWKGDDVGGMGEVSTDILLGRVEKLGRQALRLVKLQRGMVNVPWLVMNFLGDMIENEVIWDSQGTYIDLPAADQMVAAFFAAESLIETFLPEFEEIRAYCVGGNHGRMGRKRNSQHWRSNWDFILYRFLAQRFAREPRVKFFISPMPWLAYTLEHCPTWNHVVLHGDSIPNNLGIPYYGINRETAKMAQLLNIPVHYIHMGHFHTPSILDNIRGVKIINGALTGPSPFSVGRLLTGGIPQQLLFGLHPKYGKTWNYPVYLDEVREVEADEEGLYTPWVSGLERPNGAYTPNGEHDGWTEQDDREFDRAAEREAKGKG